MPWINWIFLNEEECDGTLEEEAEQTSADESPIDEDAGGRHREQIENKPHTDTVSAGPGISSNVQLLFPEGTYLISQKKLGWRE